MNLYKYYDIDPFGNFSLWSIVRYHHKLNYVMLCGWGSEIDIEFICVGLVILYQYYRLEM